MIKWAASFLLLISLVCEPLWLRPALAVDLPEQSWVAGFNGYAQAHNLSCESRSAADWAGFFGVQVSEEGILASLPRSDNPETGFVGSPDGYLGGLPPQAYGVHPPPVARVLRGLGLQAKAVQGLTWDKLRGEIAAERPVIVWVIAQMWAGAPVFYTAKDGQTAKVARYEHTMVVTGYTAQAVQVFDPAYGSYQVYGLDAFMESWGVLGQRAVILETAKATATPPAPAAPTLTVPLPKASATLPPAATATLPGTAYPPPEPSPTAVVTSTPLPSPAADITGTPQPSPAANPTDTPPTPTASQTASALPSATLPPSPTSTFLPPTATASASPAPSPFASSTPAQPTETLPAARPEHITVQAGDTFTGLAKRLNVPWQALAAYNRLDAPYFLEPGQVLGVPPLDWQAPRPTFPSTPVPEPTQPPIPPPPAAVEQDWLGQIEQSLWDLWQTVLAAL